MKAPAIETISPSHLLSPLCSMWGVETVDLVDWHVEQMKGGAGNPVSLGLYRVHGEVRLNDGTQPFTMVLKAIQSPANAGFSNLGEGDDQRHWNYWQREPLFYQSDLRDHMPPGIAIPRCYGAQAWEGQITWLWLEEIEHSRGEVRQLEELALLARHLGRLNGRFAKQELLPDAAWLGRNTHAQWPKPVVGFPRPLITTDNRPDWDHPVMQALFPATSPNPFRQFWENVDHFLGVLETLPPTWCHGDSDPSNFKIRQSSDGATEVVFFDWALTCIGVLGQDVAHVVYGSFHWFDADELDSVIRMLIDSYMDGLREMGVREMEREVWMGYAITVLVKYGVFLLFLIGLDHRDNGEAFQVTDEYKAAVRFLQGTSERLIELDR